MTKSSVAWRLVLLTLTLILVVLSVRLGLAVLSPAEELIGHEGRASPARSSRGRRLADEWQPCGGPYERVIYALALGPSPDVLYAGTWGNGLYRSADGGLTWQPTSHPGDQGGVSDPTKAQVRALAITPDGRTIYLSRWGAGIITSTDQGATWESASDPDNNIPDFNPPYELDADYLFTSVDAILIDRADPRVIYQGARDGFYRSTNGGGWWERYELTATVPAAEKPVFALAQAGDGTLYAGTWGSGVFTSANGGETWHAMPALGTGADDSDPATARRVYALATNGDAVWAGTQDGLYQIRAGEQRWVQVLPAQRVQALTLDGGGRLYAGTVDYGVYRSEDGGKKWQPYSDGLLGYASSILSLQVYDDDPPILYAATYGAGVYRNAGDEWQPINGSGDGRLPSPAFEVQSLAFAGRRRETLLAGTLVGGIYASPDRGRSWGRWRFALPIGRARNTPDIAVLGGGQTIVLAGGTGIYRSIDGGANWERVKAGLPEGDRRVVSLAQGKRDPELLLAAIESGPDVSVYRSADGGETWHLRTTLGSVDDLALGDGGNTLFAVQLGHGVLRGREEDGGRASWQLLGGSDALPHGLQIVVNERTNWQRLILGLERQSIHVRALDGIHSSYDGGETWQPSLGGRFETLYADPVRPGVLYATTMTDTEVLTATEKSFRGSPEIAGPISVEPGVATPLTDLPGDTLAGTVPLTVTRWYTPSLWVSLDDGRSWARASTSERSLVVLALDPGDHNRLFAGTPKDGVYYTRLHLPSPYTDRRALSGLTSFVILPSFICGTLLGSYLYFLLGLRLRIYPWQVWALLLRIRAWRLVGTPRSELDPLERLIAILASDLRAPFGADAMWNELQGLGVALPPVQVHNTLSGLQARRLFSRTGGDDYRYALVALARLAERNFDREALIDQVRGENLAARNAELFFGQAGFQVVVLLHRLSLWPESPHYRSLGRLNAWLHAHQKLDEKGVAQLTDGVGSGSPDLGFVVLDHIPTPGAYRAMHTARLIPLSSSVIQRAVERREAGLSLERAVREGQGQEDLFDRREPLLDHLTLFGRTAVLDSWLAAIEQDRDVYFWGLPRSGRTSTLWWLRTKAPGRWLRGYVSLRFREPDWGSVLRDLLADLLLDLRRIPSPLLDLPEVDDILAACGSDLDLEAGLRYLADRRPGSRPPRFAFFLDDAAPGAVLERLQELAERRDDVSLVVSWDGLPSGPASMDGDDWLPPLTAGESRTLLRTIGARLGLDFDDQDLDAFDRAAGGHPFLLRQLGSHAARMANRPDETRVHRVLVPGEWPDVLPPKHVSAEEAIQAYLQRRPEALAHLWRTLSPEVRRHVRLLAAGRPVDLALEPAYAGLGLLNREESGISRLRIGLLGRWLQERRL